VSDPKSLISLETTTTPSTAMDESTTRMSQSFARGSSRNSDQASTTSTATTEPSRRRMMVESNEVLLRSSDHEEGTVSSRRITAGNFVEDQVKRDFGLSSIRGTTVPERLGSEIPLDDDTVEANDEEMRHGAVLRHRDENSNDNKVRRSEIEDTIGDFFPPDDMSETNENITDLDMSPEKKRGFLSRGKVDTGADDSSWAFSANFSESKEDKVSSFMTSKRCRVTMMVCVGVLLTAVVGITVGMQENLFLDNPGGVGSKLLTRGALQKHGELATLAAVRVPLDATADRPVLWLVQKTNGRTIETIMKRCFDFSLDTEFNSDKPEDIDAIVTHMLFRAASTLKGSEYNGRMFTVLRDPLERTVDIFENEKLDGKHDMNDDSTLQEYLQEEFTDNWLTRTLTNEYVKYLGIEDVELAKLVLREKCIVGLSERLEESFDRFAKYFQWDMLNVQHQKCAREVLKLSEKSAEQTEREESDVVKVTIPEKGTHDYDLLTTKNSMDMLVYKYAQELFQEQKYSVFDAMYKS